MKKITRLIAAAALVAAGVSVAGPAQAEDPEADHQPCVNNRESHSGTLFGMDRAEVERRWEVTGKGMYVINPLGWGVVAYPWCGHKFHNHSPLPYEYVGVVYSGRGRLRALSWVHATVYGEQDPPPVVTPPPPVEPTVEPCTVKVCLPPNF